MDPKSSDKKIYFPPMEYRVLYNDTLRSPGWTLLAAHVGRSLTVRRYMRKKPRG